jgi:hypothetical protein
MILFKMMTQGLFSEIHGCVSTGKEVRDVIIASLWRHPGRVGRRIGLVSMGHAVAGF